MRTLPLGPQPLPLEPWPLLLPLAPWPLLLPLVLWLLLLLLLGPEPLLLLLFQQGREGRPGTPRSRPRPGG